MEYIKPNKKLFKQILREEKISRLSIEKEPEITGRALYQYVVWGEHSPQLKNLSLQQIKAQGAEKFVDLFKELLKTECDVYYTGKSSLQEVANATKKYLLTHEVTEKGYGPIYHPIKTYDRPTVFFINTFFTLEA